MNSRKSGVLLHITSLPSPYGIGDLGPGAGEFADFLLRSGQSIWQILPLNPSSPSAGIRPTAVIPRLPGILCSSALNSSSTTVSSSNRTSRTLLVSGTTESISEPLQTTRILCCVPPPRGTVRLIGETTDSNRFASRMPGGWMTMLCSPVSRITFTAGAGTGGLLRRETGRRRRLPLGRKFSKTGSWNTNSANMSFSGSGSA